MQTTTSILTGKKNLLYKNDTNRLIERDKLFFPVKLVDTNEYFDIDNCLPNMDRAVVIGEGKGKLVNMCSKGYQLVKLENIIKPLEALLDKEFKDYQARYRQKDNSKFYVDYLFKNSKGKVKQDVGDIYPKVTLTHSYSGDLKFSASFGFHRLVCSNGMSLPHGEQINITSKHTKSVLDTIQCIFGNMTNFIADSKTFAQQYEVLSEKKIINLLARVEEAIKGTKFNTKIKGDVMARAFYENRKLGVPKTDWLIYNAMNYQLNHNFDTLNMQVNNRMQLDQRVLKWFVNN